ncbi:MAG: type II secretion system F family protein [Candidatus Aenigmatarchaeota archaeon]
MFHKIVPRKYTKYIETNLRYSGSKKSSKTFVDSAVILSLLVGFVAALVSAPYTYYVFVGVFVGLFVLLHGFLIMGVERRSKFVENILPDALQLMSANSRAGYIPSRALLLSARPEFGPLSDAIKLVGKEMVTGKSLEESIHKVGYYIKSEMLDRTLKLIVEGSKSGGQFATLLEENATDLRRIQVIKKEVSANIMLYIIFIGFAGVIAAPALYALSSYLIGSITQLGANVVVPETVSSGSSFMSFGVVKISEEFLFLFSIASILITTIFGSLIMGLISTGKEKGGIKFLPIFVVGALAIFFGAKLMIGIMFGVIASV